MIKSRTLILAMLLLGAGNIAIDAEAKFLSVDPVNISDNGDPRYFNRYAYAFNDPVNNIDPDGRTTHVLTVYDKGVFNAPGGDHSAIYIPGRNDSPGVLYDPAGSLRLSDGYGGTYRPSTDYLVEDAHNPNLKEAFINYHAGDGKSTVREIIVDTTAMEEQQILNNSGGVDGGLSAPMECASSCANALSGVGPFEESGAIFPSRVKGMALGAMKSRGGTDTLHSLNEETGKIEERYLNVNIQPNDN